MEASRQRPTLPGVAGTLNLKQDEAGSLLTDMERQGLLSFASGKLQLTAEGRRRGRK